MAATGTAARRGRLPVLAKYEVVEELGHGGMATVYRAHDRRLGRDVAVKLIHPHLRDSKEVAHRFAVEARAVAKLRHPNIVEVFDVSGEGDPEQYLVVELLRGLSLRTLLAGGEVLPPEIAACLGVELLHALGHAHAHGVVHRDVKPENVMIEHRSPPAAASPEAGGAPDAVTLATSTESAGERVRVMLTDFGIAKLLDAQGVTSTGQVLGSPAHMAPEQIEGGDVDARADLFGLGVLLYECMVGHLPFEGTNPAQVLRRVLDGVYPDAERERTAIGKRWSRILDRALARAPEARFADARAMLDALTFELRRAQIEAPRAELEAWLDDPSGYDAEHRGRMVQILCRLGAAGRRGGDALGAAADYNRALAYAPDDPALLKIVAGMHRSEGRRRLARRALPVLAVMATSTALAFFTAKALRPQATSGRGGPVSRVPAAALTVPSPRAVSDPPSLAESPTPAPRVPPPRAAPPPKPVERLFVLESVRPPFGVLVSLDDEPLGAASDGQRIKADGRAHVLKFACVNDVCEPAVRAIEPGDANDVEVSVALTVRPARLVVEGDPSMSYGIEEFPSVPLRLGVPANVPVPRGNFIIHVVERPSGRRVSATLDPGKERHATFSTEP